MPPTTRSTHPDFATLQRFALGQLSGDTMAWVERHLGDCRDCVVIAEAVPGDRLVGLLRRESSIAVEATSSVPSSGDCGTQGPNIPPLQTWAKGDL
jgi:hypothetical protein